MGFGAAGGHHQTVEIVLDQHLLDFVLGILAAGKQILIRKYHVGQGGRIFFNRINIHDAADVNAAVADKHADTWFLLGDINLGRKFNFGDICPSGFRQVGAGQTGGGTGFGHGSGNVLGTLKYTAGIYTGSRSFDGCKRMG